MSSITLTAFRWVPPMVQGIVRDVRVRWAVEEAGLAYQTRLIGPAEQKSEEYQRLQPFGQVPAYDEDGLVLFESGAIVMHIAERVESLMPQEPTARARARVWMFAALNSIEQHVQRLTELDLFSACEDWAALRRPAVLEAAQRRLAMLAHSLEGKEFLEERFTAADLLMTTVLRIPHHMDLVARFPVLEAYRLRCEARPAFQRALADHMAPFATKPGA